MNADLVQSAVWLRAWSTRFNIPQPKLDGRQRGNLRNGVAISRVVQLVLAAWPANNSLRYLSCSLLTMKSLIS